MLLFHCILDHCNILVTSKNTLCCTCDCHWSGERTSFLVLKHSCFRRSKLFSRFQICKQKSCCFFFKKQDVWANKNKGGQHLFQNPDLQSGKPACGCLCVAGPHRERLQPTPGKWPDSPANTQQPPWDWILVIRHRTKSGERALIHQECKARRGNITLQKMLLNVINWWTKTKANIPIM